MRIVAIVATALCLFATSNLKAEERPFYLNRDGTVEQRVSAVEDEVVLLRKQVSEIAEQLKTKSKAAAPAKAEAKERITYKVSGECESMSQVPPGATDIVRWPATTAAVQSATYDEVSLCPNGVCSSQSDSWFIGKRLGRRR